jgi:hypothetical protein
MEQHIINEIVNDYILKGSDVFQSLYDKNNTLVLEHPKYPKYLLKLSNKDFQTSQIQSRILSSISTENTNICRIHRTQIHDDNGNTRTMELMDKLNGTSKREYSKSEIASVIRATKQLQDDLNERTDKYHANLPSIGILFSGITKNAENDTLKLIANRIQTDEAYERFLDVEKAYIIVADMVYENILIDKDTVNFIDLDPMILGPKRLQFSILVTSNLLIQSNQFKRLSMGLIECYACLWSNDKITREDLIALSIFPLLILSMRQVDIDTLPENHDSMDFKLKTILLFIMVELDSREKNKDLGSDLCDGSDGHF